MEPLNDSLVDRIRSEANIADRPGQYDRLMAIAADVEALIDDHTFHTRFVRRARSYGGHPRWLGWAIRNRWHGYKFGPIQRHRCCDHTTPSHYRWCANHE